MIVAQGGKLVNIIREIFWNDDLMLEIFEICKMKDRQGS